LIIWIDAQLSPALAAWLTETFGIESHAVKELGLHTAKDSPIFHAARDAEGVVVMSKDSDFLLLLDRFGPPPQILWITCGNTSNARLKQILRASLPRALDLLRQGERLVEISDTPVPDESV
jgi:predicted nuclease of predicted toxin-antitoxin system